MRIDVYIHAADHDDPIMSMLGKVIAALQKVEHTMSVLSDKIDALTDEVTALRTVEDSAVALIEGLSAIIADLKNSTTDPALLVKIDAALAAINEGKNKLAAGVAAGTPTP
jgi:hypothetical protein